MRLSIRSVDPQGAVALELLRLAAIEARELYPELFAADAPWPGNPPLWPRGLYVVAFDAHGRPLACGAVRPLDDITGELRRMYVVRAARRGGVARAVLAHLEAEARALGYARLLLETGHRQHAAMALYASCGYQRVDAFGDHVGDPASVCFGKSLA